MGFVILALLMNAPVWFVLARVSSLSGGDGFHRSELLNQGFIHLGDWWLAGMNIQDTSAWFPYTVEATGGADMTNQFLYYGIVAGLGAMVLFFALLVRAFKNLGAALIAVRTRAPTAAAEEFIIWGLGVMLAAHLVNWLGITYFDQFAVVWYMQLAAISNLCLEVSKTAENKSKEILHGST